jgi:hypothetical protein
MSITTTVTPPAAASSRDVTRGADLAAAIAYLDDRFDRTTALLLNLRQGTPTTWEWDPTQDWDVLPAVLPYLVGHPDKRNDVGKPRTVALVLGFSGSRTDFDRYLLGFQDPQVKEPAEHSAAQNRTDAH